MNAKLLLKIIDHAYFGMLFSLIKNINIYMKDKQEQHMHIWLSSYSGIFLHSLFLST